MLARALDGDGLIGVPTPVERERKDGPPPRLHPIFGVGRVVDYETHEDGTSHMELLGVGRVNLIEELPSSPYRTARVEALAEIEPSTPDARSVKSDLRAALKRLEPLGMNADAKASLHDLFEKAGDDVSFLVNVMATTTVADPSVRRALLELDDVYDRGRQLATLLETLRQELSGRNDAEEDR
jgi:Lon protease-like protein